MSWFNYLFHFSLNRLESSAVSRSTKKHGLFDSSVLLNNINPIHWEGMEWIGCRQSNLGHHGDCTSSVVPKLPEMGQWFTRVKSKWILGGESTVIPGLGVCVGLIGKSLLWGASSFHLVWSCSQSPEKTHRIMGGLEHQTGRIVYLSWQDATFSSPHVSCMRYFGKEVLTSLEKSCGDLAPTLCEISANVR